MVKKAGVIVTLAALIGMILLCRAGSGMLRERIAEGRKVSARPESREGCLVIIDPGHGGLDAGKIGVNGKEEKEINLNVSLKIQKLLKEQGVEVEMTRTEDERLGETQVEDLKAREELTPRETDVLRCVARGCMNKEIADELCISVNTVLTHRKNIAAKLGIKTVSGLSLYAMMNGLVEPR
jgi:DNA-binding CsgD family transcriptional regulator